MLYNLKINMTMLLPQFSHIKLYLEISEKAFKASSKAYVHEKDFVNKWLVSCYIFR